MGTDDQAKKHLLIGLRKGIPQGLRRKDKQPSGGVGEVAYGFHRGFSWKTCLLGNSNGEHREKTGDIPHRRGAHEETEVASRARSQNENSYRRRRCLKKGIECASERRSE